jgi:hypothetical protein
MTAQPEDHLTLWHVGPQQLHVAIRRMHRGEQECNAQVGRYSRRRWLFWNATSRSGLRNCHRGTPELSCKPAGLERCTRLERCARLSAAATR